MQNEPSERFDRNGDDLIAIANVQRREQEKKRSRPQPEKVAQ